MTKRIHPDVKGLKMACRALEMTSERMRAATIEFLIDKYIRQPIRDKQRELQAALAEDANED